MKILLVSPLPPPSGGMARWTQMYLDKCQQMGITVELVNSCVSVARANRISRSFSWFDEIKRTWNIIQELRRARKRFKPDIIHLCSPCTKWGLMRDYLCVQVAGDTPLVFHCHCNIVDQATTRLSQWILKRIVAKSQSFWLLNSFSYKWAEKFIPSKIKLVPNFITLEREYNAEIRKQLKRIIYVGHVRYSKGIQEIYKVAEACAGIEFQVVGPAQQLPSEPKPDNVVLLGEVPHVQVSELLRKADVFFFPSHTEGFANVMLEAMAAGLPIIATDVGANRDMIENKGGIIVPVGNYAEMIAAIEKLQDAALRQQMSAWNIQKVHNNYMTEKVMQQMKTYYEEILL